MLSTDASEFYELIYKSKAPKDVDKQIRLLVPQRYGYGAKQAVAEHKGNEVYIHAYYETLQHILYFLRGTIPLVLLIL